MRLAGLNKLSLMALVSLFVHFFNTSLFNTATLLNPLKALFSVTFEWHALTILLGYSNRQSLTILRTSIKWQPGREKISSFGSEANRPQVEVGVDYQSLPGPDFR